MPAKIKKSNIPLTRLRLQWVLFTLAAGTFIWLTFEILIVAWYPGYAGRWMVQAAVLSIFPLVVLWRGLPDNRRPGETYLVPTLGAGNLLTAIRGILIAALAGFLFLPRPIGWIGWIPGVLYTVAALADLFDGYLARKFHQATRLGEILDMSFDGLGVLVGSFLLVQYGQAPGVYLLVGLARYLFLFGSWIRRRAGKPVFELAESRARRPLAGAQMGFIAVTLFPVFSPPGITLAAALFALPFLVSFLLDWLVVSGVLNSAPSKVIIGIHTRGKSFNTFLLRWMPVTLRFLATGLLVIWLLSANRPIMPMVGFLAGLGGIMVAAGAAGRLAALMVLFSLGIHTGSSSLGLIEVCLLIVAIAIFFMGSGAYSIWVPERQLISRRLGDTGG
jgi:CDP-diacylglycerol---glycerol-3-phosphate 3-phosphatidyltransferase